jgi:quercetin dioxygenase-like cupin family protein
MHHVGRLAETASDPGLYAAHSDAYVRRPLVDLAAGSPHQGLTVADLAAGGRVARHVQAYEEALYVLEGRMHIDVAGRREELSADDYCFIEKGVPHALENTGGNPARWLELTAPQPGSDMITDTVFLPDEAVLELPELAFRRGHFDLSALPPPSSALGLAGFGAANVGGAALEILIKQDFGASQFNLMVVQYAPGGFIAEHDHAFEEAFFFLSGEIEAVLDGAVYTLTAGDYCWSGVQSRHALTNRSNAPVRWLETQVPQPPSRHQARFKAEWDRLVEGLDLGSTLR